MRNAEIITLRALMSRVLEVDPDHITPDLKYKEIPQWDSISHMFLIDEIEQTFQIQIFPEDILKMNSFQNIIEILKSYQVTVD